MHILGFMEWAGLQELLFAPLVCSWAAIIFAGHFPFTLRQAAKALKMLGKGTIVNIIHAVLLSMLAFTVVSVLYINQVSLGF